MSDFLMIAIPLLFIAIAIVAMRKDRRILTMDGDKENASEYQFDFKNWPDSASRIVLKILEMRNDQRDEDEDPILVHALTTSSYQEHGSLRYATFTCEGKEGDFSFKECTIYVDGESISLMVGTIPMDYCPFLINEQSSLIFFQS